MWNGIDPLLVSGAISKVLVPAASTVAIVLLRAGLLMSKQRIGETARLLGRAVRVALCDALRGLAVIHRRTQQEDRNVRLGVIAQQGFMRPEAALPTVM